MSLICIAGYGQEKTFEFYKLEGSTFVNIPYKVGISSDSESVKQFKLNLPIKTEGDIKDVNLMSSSIIYELLFKSKSRIYIISNETGLSTKDGNLVEIDKNNIENLIEESSLEDVLSYEDCKLWIKDVYPDKGVKLKNKRKHAFLQKGGFLVLYLNVKNSEIEKFNNSLINFIQIN